MNLAIRFLVVTVLAAFAGTPSPSQNLRENVLRDAALDAGLVRPPETHVTVPHTMAAVGKRLFESRLLSLAKDTACASCHLDQFGSADGLPNAIGTEATGIGDDRVLSGGDIIPRNTLPFWGRGGAGFDVFFWDGKVDASDGKIYSQFLGQEPSQDPLVVAIHLPPVAVGEMLGDTIENAELMTERVQTAEEIFKTLAARVRDDPTLGAELGAAKRVEVEQLVFLDIADAIAAFIRQNFRVKATRFHDFVFEGRKLSKEEISGGLLFYGKGRCSACHSGPYFSDFKFHPIPFPQVGFGKNGFGIDYGRFNVTRIFDDRYSFRTPPLYNVSKTAPYSHSGTFEDLHDAIRVHFDPLVFYDPDTMSSMERLDFYERLLIWGKGPLNGVQLSKRDISLISTFLHTLNYDSESEILVVD